MIDDLIQQFDNSDPFAEIDQDTRERMAKLRAEKVFAGVSEQEREALSPPPLEGIPAEVASLEPTIWPTYSGLQRGGTLISPAEDPAIKALYVELDQAKVDRDQAIAQRDKAIAQLAIMKSKGNGSGKVNPDGSLTITVIIGADTVLQMSAYQENWGTPLIETAQRLISESVDAYMAMG